MPFDTRRWPNAVTVALLIAERMGMGCGKYARHVVIDPAALSLALETPVPSPRRPVQMHTLWIKAERGEAGVAQPALAWANL